MNPVTELALAKARLQMAGVALYDSGRKELFDENSKILGDLMMHIRKVEGIVNGTKQTTTA